MNKLGLEPSDFGNFKNWNFLKNVPENRIRSVWPTILLRREYRLKYGKRAPFNAGPVNLLHGRRYPKRILPVNERIVFGKPKNITNFSGRMQLKGTCWFQAILNGWLLSRIGRKVIKERLTAFKKSSNVRKLTKNQFNACPSRKHIPQAYFWSYVEHMLNPKEWNTAFRVNVMRGIQFPEGKLIRSSGLRSPNKNVIGGSLRDVYSFNSILFNGRGDDYVLLKTYTNPTHEIPRRFEHGTTLSHAYINCSKHAIAAYIALNGKPMIYDSNMPRPQYLDWVRHPQSILNHFRINYPTLFSKEYTITAKYLRHYKPSNAGSPETRRFNKSKLVLETKVLNGITKYTTSKNL
jgi:hypothetical protein